MYAIHAIDHDLWKITLPCPEVYPWMPAARPSNVYVLVGEAPTLINAGHPLQGIALGRALREIGIPPERIERVIATGWSIHLAGGIQAFPSADLYLYSPDMMQPVDYQTIVSRARQSWQSVVDELVQDHGYDEVTTQAEMDAFFDTYFPPVVAKLPFIPVREGHVICAGERKLEVISTPGPEPAHISLFEREKSELFSGELTLDGLPDRIDEVQNYLEAQERLMALEAKRLLPNFGEPVLDGRATQRLRRGARFLNNFLMNATSALHGAPKLIDFSEQDLGFKPRDVPRFAATLLAHRAFFEELVRSRGITSAGDGITRRYGVDLEPAPAHRAASHSPSLVPLSREDL